MTELKPLDKPQESKETPNLSSPSYVGPEKKTEKLEKKEVKQKERLVDHYQININNILVDIHIIWKEEKPVPIYDVSITNISEHTKLILEKIREEFVSKINIGEIEDLGTDQMTDIRERFQKEINGLITKYFPKTDQKTADMLINYMLQESLGLGKIEILLKDKNLEEVVINNHTEPVWVYHKKYGWLETTVHIPSEGRIRHYATMIGREIGKEITNLNPLMDAHLLSGDRVNATLNPISTKGNTITIRKFAADPWTITKFINQNVISFEAAALVWLAIQNELSILIAGGTGSGKTSMLNVISNFFPPNQRMISIEDTRELVLPKNLHWIPMETRLPNPEGKGGVSMLDLLINSLRMRPDRILVGEIRRKAEAEVLLEAMHTGHSVYSTIHANNAEEVITRLTNPPIDIPKPVISSLSLIIVQNRNRRTNKRRTLQIAEVLPNGELNLLMRFNVQKDELENVNPSRTVLERLKLYSGMTDKEIQEDLKVKTHILKWLVKNNIDDVHKIGMIFSRYYTGTLKLEEEDGNS
ncbi:MAG TPA: ATPase, T2SS/T4P/T4SS family [Candidatus Nanoarchaeia archaeon]|nr:ATPase, T2SS/T4P/T4SS family [Candidatus Nanoarchaeia archaeon]